MPVVAVRPGARKAIWWGFKEVGITIAFPQVDVHFDPPVNEVLQLLNTEP